MIIDRKSTRHAHRTRFLYVFATARQGGRNRVRRGADVREPKLGLSSTSSIIYAGMQFRMGRLRVVAWYATASIIMIH